MGENFTFIAKKKGTAVRLKLGLLSVFMLPVLANNSLSIEPPILALTAACGFGANLAPEDTKSIIKSNTWSLGVTAAVAFLTSNANSFDEAEQRRLAAFVLTYLGSAGLGRLCHSIATSEIKKRDCCCLRKVDYRQEISTDKLKKDLKELGVEEKDLEQP